MKKVMNVSTQELPKDVAYLIKRDDNGELNECTALVDIEEVPTVLQFAVELAYHTAVSKIGLTRDEAVLEVTRMTLESIKKAQ